MQTQKPLLTCLNVEMCVLEASGIFSVRVVYICVVEHNKTAFP